MHSRWQHADRSGAPRTSGSVIVVARTSVPHLVARSGTGGSAEMRGLV